MQTTIAAITAALALTGLPIMAQAQSVRAGAAVDLAHRAEELRPGQWVWAPEISPSGPVIIYVDLNRQLVTVYRNGVRIGVSTSSSGRRGYETPAGVFTILQKNARHRSNRYNNAPMPYMMRLTWDGVALHGGAVRDGPVSHGCIRLPLAFARALFAITPVGGTVVVVGDAAAPPEAPTAGVLTPVREGGGFERRAPLPIGQAYSWTPHASSFGPVTVVMSLRDQSMVVVRNGVEIGRARVSVVTDDTSTRVLAYNGHTSPQWTDVSLAGGDALSATPASALLERVRMPAPFEQAMRAVLTPGATMLVTEASVADAHTPSVPEPAILETVPFFDTER